MIPWAQAKALPNINLKRAGWGSANSAFILSLILRCIRVSIESAKLYYHVQTFDWLLLYAYAKLKRGFIVILLQPGSCVHKSKVKCQFRHLLAVKVPELSTLDELLCRAD